MFHFLSFMIHFVSFMFRFRLLFFVFFPFLLTASSKEAGTVEKLKRKQRLAQLGSRAQKQSQACFEVGHCQETKLDCLNGSIVP
jgi:hypothetical protein